MRMIILKKKFQKFCLTSRLESLKDILGHYLVKKKKKKKKIKKGNEIIHDKDIIPKDINSEKQIISEEGKDN